jgi:transcriptional regulator with XRE-family HTH domain
MSEKYAQWGNFIRQHRKQRFRSAREFCQKVVVGISYPQYSRYEAGEQLPSIEQAINLFKLLGIPFWDGFMEWSEAQVADPQVLHELQDMRIKLQDLQKTTSGQNIALSAKATTMGDNVPLDEVVVFNRSHLKIFNSDPVYRDIFTYVNAFSPEWVNENQISDALAIPVKKLEKMLEKLRDLGVLLGGAGKFKAAKKNYYYPDDDDFFVLRNSNFDHNTQSILDDLTRDDLAKKKAFRGLLTRELTAQQVQTIIQHLEEFLSNVVAMPETDSPEAIYSLCVLLGKRFTRSRAALRQTTNMPELSASPF